MTAIQFPKLTKMEREILNHRLEVPDAIYEFLKDGEHLTPADLALVGDVIDKLWPNLDVDGAMAISENVTKWVLFDCVDGSTAGADNDQSRQWLSACHRVGDSLAEKISAFIGREVVFKHH